MNADFVITTHVEVVDERKLYEAAMYAAIHDDGMSRTEAEGIYRVFVDGDPDDWEVNVQACLTRVYAVKISAPGVETHDSFIEERP